VCCDARLRWYQGVGRWAGNEQTGPVPLADRHGGCKKNFIPVCFPFSPRKLNGKKNRRWGSGKNVVIMGNLVCLSSLEVK